MAQTKSVLLDPDQIDFAKHAAEVLSGYVGKLKKKELVKIRAEDGGPTIEVPLPAFRLLLEILRGLSIGDGVSVVRTHAELTTQEAANILNVSRPYLIGLVEKGAIPCRKVGNRRKIRLIDLLDFQERDDEERRRVREKLAEEAENLGLTY
ncbi:MAG: helix-turn-helix domain-containing protein [Planctomycetes bacterium]|nr:helix-turn-helix domain-containing protein [Planctomycetota bacterium]